MDILDDLFCYRDNCIYAFKIVSKKFHTSIGLQSPVESLFSPISQFFLGASFTGVAMAPNRMSIIMVKYMKAQFTYGIFMISMFYYL